MKKEDFQSLGLANSTKNEQHWSQSMIRQDKRRKLMDEQKNKILGCLSGWNSEREFLNLVQNEEMKYL